MPNIPESKSENNNGHGQKTIDTRNAEEQLLAVWRLIEQAERPRVEFGNYTPTKPHNPVLGTGELKEFMRQAAELPRTAGEVIDEYDKAGVWVNPDASPVVPVGTFPGEPGHEIRTKSETGGEKGVKEDAYDLIPTHPLRMLARLFGRGAQKYAAHNWRRGYEWSKSYAAIQRHANLFWSGEDYDEETGLPHLAAVAWHAFVLMEFMRLFPNYDDREFKN